MTLPAVAPEGTHSHLLVLAIGAGAIVTYQLLGARWHELSYDGIEILVLLAMVWGIGRHRPRPAVTIPATRSGSAEDVAEGVDVFRPQG